LAGSFLPALHDYLNSMVEFDTFYAGAYISDAPPVTLYHKTWDRDEEHYASGPYLLDPFYVAWSGGLPDGCYRLKDVAPSGFTQSEYFINYYRQLNQRDEIGFFATLSNAVTMHVSLGRGVGLPRFSATEATVLDDLTPTVRAVTHAAWNSDYASHQVAQADRSFHRNISDAVSSFGKSELTPRESEITHLILKGHSVKSVAEILKISPDTVRTHQKSVYSKLKIRSLSELFGLFIERLSQFSPQ
jgi:DNA-binding CsgD family transcriptional regulator